ncbi:glycerol-3-phosphate responsive antiterminator [Ammoniphilus sp. YIM 78166]|uniref:glycerol-3-phosphate responsive antiterminator n=1 Tax=Ammoniphilus sp. YIM 78166 TaxID=1644106 RepID=UPI00106F3446|nr:glycerol-3-phosphate responsive antiterminator [Ammoniphilus sp. YIM 78166]
MDILDQKIIPAAKDMKDFERFLTSSYVHGIFLDVHIARLKNLHEMALSHGKQMFLHADLIQGLKNDEYATEYICQEIQPAGIISTRANVILTAKKKGVLAIQRLFLLDTNALEKSYAIFEKTKPDYIEVLPGGMPHIIAEVVEKTGIPMFAGGFIRTVDDVERALEAGAKAITTSNKQLWKHYQT